MTRIDVLPAQAAAHLAETRRPLVTLTYAQSIDGSIAARPGVRTTISGDESKAFTHRLRHVHDAILVGIGTVLADDPRLTARLGGGDHPQPVILDTHLRFPPTSRLLTDHPTYKPWIITGSEPSMFSVDHLKTAGARIIPTPTGSDGRLSLTPLLHLLGSEGITSLMVEGGAQVIRSFLSQELADLLIVTIAPLILSGLLAVTDLTLPGGEPPRLRDVTYEQFGEDVVLWGAFTR